MKALRLLKIMYWSLQRDRGAIPHIIAVLYGVCQNILAFYLDRLCHPQRTTIAIALIQHMGDIVAAEPVAREARRAFPSARISWVVRPAYASLPENIPTVDRVITVSCLTEWMLLRALGFAEVSWDLHMRGLTCPICRVPFDDADEPSVLTYETYYKFGNLLAVQCHNAGIPILIDGPRLQPDPSAARAVQALGLPDRFVAIHCASNDVARDWPADRWRSLVAHLTTTMGVHVVEIGMAARAVEPGDSMTTDMCGRLSILQTAELLRRAVLFIGIDSGPAHIANAVGVPGIILLGRFHNFVRYMPYSGAYETDADLVWADGPVAELALGPVVEAAERRLLAA